MTAPLAMRRRIPLSLSVTLPVPALLLELFSLSLLCCLPLSSSDQPSCHVYRLGVYRGSGPPLPPLLTLYNNTEYNSTYCSYSFLQHDAVWGQSVGCHNQGRQRVHTCPRHCLRSVSDSRVYGSFPYDGNSSICLSALHSGIIKDELGGAVIIERFYPLTWDGDSSQSVFPHGSDAASFSNGVQSLPVPAHWWPLPSPVDSYSFTVRSRGVIASQRQLAPFSPRSGHLHLLFSAFVGYEHWSHHLIIGGRNSSHFFNDVWYFQANTYRSIDWQAAENGRWWRLQDAPFSPRADMLSKWLILLPQQSWDPFDPSSGSPVPPSVEKREVQAWLVLGGQTDDACGQPLLGLCSDEVWQLNVTLTPVSISPPGLSFAWSPRPVGRLPQPTRCGASLLHDKRLLTSGQSAIVGIAGGQRSYDSGHCLSGQVESLNDAWYARFPELEQWTRGRDAPFSPRRSMMEEASLVSVMDDAPFFFMLNAMLDKSVSLAGGIRYLSHRFNSSTGASVMTAAEVYADAWSCTLVTPEHDVSALDCDWHHSFMTADTSRPPPFLSSGSLPIPLARAASVDDGTHEQPYRFGGATSRAAVQAWLHTPPPGQLEDAFAADLSQALLNITMLQQPQQQVGPVLDDPPMTVEDSRLGLPLVSPLDEEELNSATSAFSLGSEAVLSYWRPTGRWKVSPQVSTLHLQELQMAESEDESSPWLPQAASSRNTTRGRFQFRVGRLGHGTVTMRNAQIISGGESGGCYYNDWISYHPNYCLLPDDPSYLSLLGPVQVAELEPTGTGWTLLVAGLYGGFHGMAYAAGQVAVGDSLPVICAPGYHFVPPLMQERYALLTCAATGVFMDVALGGVRRCVKDRLLCRWPFVDAGYGRCVDPLPVLSSMRVIVSDIRQQGPQPSNPSLPTQVIGLTTANGLILGTRRLLLSGQWFSHPITVQIMSASSSLCSFPQLLDTRRYCSGSSGSSSANGSSELCRFFGSSISCLLPTAVLPFAQRVIATIGRRGQVISSAWTHVSADSAGPSLAKQTPLTIASVKPAIVSLTSDSCRPAGDPLGIQLVDCPYNRSFYITAVVSNAINPVVLDGSQRLNLYWADPGRGISCSSYAWRDLERPTDPLCDNRLPSLGNCSETPSWFIHCRVVMPSASHTIAVGNDEISNTQQLANPDTAPRLTVAACPQGTFTNFTAESLNMSQRCQQCDAGTSTNSGTGQQFCALCPRGHYSQAGWANCLPCPADTFAAELGSTVCSRCGRNQWQSNNGSGQCNTCSDGQYKLLQAASSAAGGASAVPSLTCAWCPEGVSCSSGGAILSAGGQFILIDSQTGLLTTTACSLSACVDGWEDEGCQQTASSFIASSPNDNSSRAGVQIIHASGLGVVQCCGEHRLPSVDASGQVNVLCSQCLPGFTEMAGRCIPCRTVAWPPVIALAALAVVFLFLLHRFSGATGSATLSIVVYFVQMSLLFLPADVLPFWLSVVNVSLDTGQVSSLCILPLDDYGKIAARALSPLLAASALLALLGLQLAVRAAINTAAASSDRPSACVQRAIWLYSRLIPPAAFPSRQPEEPATASASMGGQLQLPLLSRDEWRESREESGRVVPSAPSASSSFTGDSLLSVCRSYKRSGLLLMLFSYNTLSTACLATLHSRPVGQYGQRLWSYPSIDMSQRAYRMTADVMIALLVVAVIGCPVTLLLYLSARRRCRPKGEDVEQQLELQLSAVPPSSALAVLTGAYRPALWFYSVVILLRRLLLIVVFTFVPAPACYSWLSLVNILLIGLQLLTWPYRSAADNWLETGSLIALALLTNTLTTYATRQRPQAVSALLIFLFLLPVLAALLLSARRWARRWRAATAEQLRQAEDEALPGL